MPRQFRLIDLLVVVGVVGFMAGLMVPAVRTDGPGCRASCQNHLKNVALALAGYQTAFGRFPPSVVTGAGHGSGQSCFTAILPYGDEQELFNAYNFSLEVWHPANEPVVSSPVKVFTCPELRWATVPAAEVLTVGGSGLPGRTEFGVGHFAVNWGGGRHGYGQDFAATFGRDRGVMRVNWGARPQDLGDGAATTLLAGEKRGGQAWAVGGWGSSEFDVGPTPAYLGNDPTARRVYNGSDHSYGTSGANFAFCDCAVRFLTATLDRKVWYALITRDGREAVTPDQLP